MVHPPQNKEEESTMPSVATRHTLVSILFLAVALACAQARAEAGQIQVRETVTLKAGADAVWALIGDFNGLYRWHPAVVNSILDGDRSQAGSLRILVLGDGARIVERQQSHDDGQRSYGYEILYSPLPVSGYQSQISVTPMGGGKCQVSWSSTFSAAGATDAKAEETIRGIYRAGLDHLASLFN
ncbi:MAG: SRPBCC family protein [Gammaproteobacteria bacterium]|nr:MAG: SRPBCC family protein [Gammaproteobacteria bacterium]